MVVGTGRKLRVVPHPTDVAQLGVGYLTASGRKLGDDDACIRTHDRTRRGVGPISTRAIGLLVARLATDAGNTTTSPHSLRHSFAVSFLQRRIPQDPAL